MSVKSQLKRSLYSTLLQDNKGSFATRADRRGILMRSIVELIDLGYKIISVEQIKQKHVVALANHWKNKQLNPGTIKNRLSSIRNLACLIKKPDLVPTNKFLAIGSRYQALIKNRAIYNPDFSKITDPHIKISLELQRVFGLRREESLKIKPHMADKGNKLSLLGSWCKGNRSRNIPIRTEEQRYWLDQAKLALFKPNQSLIPEHKTYIHHRYVYDKQLQRAGLRSHGLRHADAQQRYYELTGWQSPILGGPYYNDMMHTQQNDDMRARMILTEELGHSRIQIQKII